MILNLLLGFLPYVWARLEKTPKQGSVRFSSFSAREIDMATDMGRFGVLDADSLHLSDGQLVPRQRAFATFADLAAAARRLGLSQLWVIAGALDTLDYSPAGVGGWNLSTPEPEQAAQAFWQHSYEPGASDRRAVDLAFCANDNRGLFSEIRDGGYLLRALSLYAKLTGIPFAWSAGSTGARLLRQLHNVRGGLTLDAPDAAHLPPPALDAGTEIALVWQRALTPAERAMAYLHTYDKNGQYLAAASSLRLGVGAAMHLTAAEIGEAHANMPGYWRVRVELRPRNALEASLPPPYRSPRNGGLAWVTTPTLQLLRELEWVEVCTTEAWLWPDSHRPLEPWYKVLRGARARLMELGQYADAQIALRMVKATYAHMSGYLAYAGGEHDRTSDTLYRPDWRHAWVAQARANLYRRVVNMAHAGAAPFAVGMDALYLASGTADPRAAVPVPVPLRFDDSLAGWKVSHQAVPMQDVTALADAYAPNYLHELQVWLNCRASGTVYTPARRAPASTRGGAR